MATINFSKLPCFVDIRKQETQEVDIHYDFSNAMYMRGQGVAMGALAMKIYNEETEYNDNECDIILSFAKSLSPIVYDSILAVIHK